MWRARERERKKKRVRIYAKIYRNARTIGGKRYETKNEPGRIWHQKGKCFEIKTAMKLNSIAPNVLECTKMNVIDIVMANMVIGFLRICIAIYILI